jgi:hypothetical protein
MTQLSVSTDPSMKQQDFFFVKATCLPKSLKNLTHEQTFIGRKQDVFHLHTFGTQVYVQILAHQHSKMNPKDSKCILLG